MLFHYLTLLRIAPIFIPRLEAEHIVFAMEGLPVTHESRSTAEFGFSVYAKVSNFWVCKILERPAREGFEGILKEPACHLG